ncbi:DUF1294 domain-containing protein [Anaerovorax odorimutans]|uniref:DUF1294 domain-containing protein n=1 Tax=Anaerovorax odorimutans TaxID=109327 RepID=UPI000417932F|nr:DUF1294 domain-containing protein [Anaerovorax odorimutans]
MNLKLAVILIIWNLIVFLLMGLDKYKSIHNKWRISEKTLLLSAFFMGGAGAFIGSLVFRHKTKKIKFKILLPTAVVLNFCILVYLINFIL